MQTKPIDRIFRVERQGINSVKTNFVSLIPEKQMWNSSNSKSHWNIWPAKLSLVIHSCNIRLALPRKWIGLISGIIYFLKNKWEIASLKVYILLQFLLLLYSSCISQKPRVIEKFGLVDLTMFLAKFAATEIKRRQNDNRQPSASQLELCSTQQHTENFLLFFGANWWPRHY